MSADPTETHLIQYLDPITGCRRSTVLCRTHEGALLASLRGAKTGCIGTTAPSLSRCDSCPVVHGGLTPEHVTDLRDRLERVDRSLAQMAHDHPESDEKTRLMGKSQGVRLALSYLAEYEGGTP